MSMSPRLLRPRATGFNPKSISGLVAWFDADDVSTFTLNGTAVSEWRDKSGNGYSVSQGTANNQPERTGTIQGRACLDFDGTNDYLSSDNTGLSAAMNGDKSITAFVVGEMHTAAEHAINIVGTWIGFGSSSSGTPFWYIRSNSGNGNGQIVVRNDASSSAGQHTAAALGPAGDGSDPSALRDFFICSATSPSQGQQVWRSHTVLSAVGDGISPRPINGSTSTETTSRPAGALTVNRFSIGALGRNTFSDFFPARIAEVIIYGSALSGPDRAKVVSWLSKKYSNVSVPVL